MKTFPLALLLLLAACASNPEPLVEGGDWAHPTKDELEWKGEMEDCKRFHGSHERSVQNCMVAKGWKQKTKPWRFF